MERPAAGINAARADPRGRPHPAAVKGRWKLVIVCYHDQGHAPFKAVYGDDGVNITVGLPVVRVSVDHGTAFDIAGQGIAREGEPRARDAARSRAGPRLGSRVAHVAGERGVARAPDASMASMRR